MPDEAVQALMSRVRGAAQESRLALLARAMENGTVVAEDAPALTGCDPTTGTAGYHLRELVKLRLLRRCKRGEYELTDLGIEIYTCLAQLTQSQAISPRSQQRDVLMALFVGDISLKDELDRVAPEALHATLQRCLADGSVEPAGAFVITLEELLQ